jgi:hypothetical protein
MMVHQMNPEMRQCIDACTECSSICRETVNYCLERGGRLAEPKQLRMLMDCAEMCRTNADFMVRPRRIRNPAPCARNFAAVVRKNVSGWLVAMPCCSAAPLLAAVVRRLALRWINWPLFKLDI